MSGIIEFFKCVYATELAGINTGVKCLGDQKNPWAVGCTYGVTLGKSGAGFLKATKTGDWRRDPCVVHCGIWKRVKRLIGRFKLKGKFEYHIPSGTGAWRGTAFTIDVADDGTTLIAVLDGEVEFVEKERLQSVVVSKGQQITIAPQKPLTDPCEASKGLLNELAKWRENIINEESIEELNMPENTVIELPKGRLNYCSLSDKGG